MSRNSAGEGIYGRKIIMELVDYTGKINSHKEYLNALKQLEAKSKYIEYVIINDEETEIIDKFSNSVTEIKQKNKWWGTKSSAKAKIYKITTSKDLFQYLKKYETFCKYTVSIYGDIAENTDFGINDIAFFDDKEMPLLFTTTHEGYITIRNDLFS